MGWGENYFSGGIGWWLWLAGGGWGSEKRSAKWKMINANLAVQEKC
jgi:hypothetical protein